MNHSTNQLAGMHRGTSANSIDPTKQASSVLYIDSNQAASASLNYVTLTSLPKANPELLQKQFISNHSSSYPLLNSSNADTTQRRIMKLQEQGQERSMKFDYLGLSVNNNIMKKKNL